MPCQSGISKNKLFNPLYVYCYFTTHTNLYLIMHITPSPGMNTLYSVYSLTLALLLSFTASSAFSQDASLLQAAEQGYAPAQFNLGNMYANGEGVPENDTEAVKWYRKAAEQGHAGAQFNLGFMYDNGRGVPQNDTEAVKWYRKAAEQGLAQAQVSLGFMYAYGRGVPENHIEAYAWVNLASAQGGYAAEGASMIKSLLRFKGMTPAQVAEAQERSIEIASSIVSGAKGTNSP